MPLCKKLWKMWENRDIKLDNWKKKELFSIRTKLSKYKVFHRKFTSNTNEKQQQQKNRYLWIKLSI